MVVGNCHCKEGVIGDNCTECAVGEFGAPDLEVNCQSCSDFCENIKNPECHLSEDLLTPICDNCGPNYTGSLCQDCANGFYRNSSVSFFLSFVSLVKLLFLPCYRITHVLHVTVMEMLTPNWVLYVTLTMEHV